MHVRLTAAAAACGLAVAVGACQSLSSGPRVDSDAIAEAAGPGRTMIHGSATYFEKMLMPIDSVLSVRLVDRDAAPDSKQAILAEAAFSDIAGPPYAFVLPYDPDRLKDDGRYGITASLTTPQGETFFATAEPVPFEPGDPGKIEFRMMRLPTP
ncbi:YbaY family lipoprotein [Luteimonas sp. R10]|uniref:YbaY family lipoprotein n=1 Tax=Luteimonas sp. R10 TaxID=3108176 RepID=UPI0030868392|nr:YbaY family lipoprotein [Luteimonas sp. R10]